MNPKLVEVLAALSRIEGSDKEDAEAYIAYTAGVSRSRASTLLNSLVKLGLAEVREGRVVLTEKGKLELARLMRLRSYFSDSPIT